MSQIFNFKRVCNFFGSASQASGYGLDAIFFYMSVAERICPVLTAEVRGGLFALTSALHVGCGGRFSLLQNVSENSRKLALSYARGSLRGVVRNSDVRFISRVLEF